jgi:hypothetical protein
LLRANVGKRVTLTLGDRRNITGTLAQVLDIAGRQRPARPQPHRAGVFSSNRILAKPL